MRNVCVAMCTGLFVLCQAWCDTPLAKGMVSVAVASNFAETQAALAKAFTKSTGHEVTSSSGSTGKLYAQIANGGPFDLFLSADEEHAQKLEAAGVAVEGSRFTYATGRLALHSPTVKGIDKGVEALKAAPITHLSVANPETAPYGLAAVSAMQKLGIWDTFKERVVYGENIAQTMQFIESGGAEAGFVAYSQVVKRPKTTYWLVPEEMHAPLKQDAVLLTNSRENEAAKAYLAFLRGKAARKIITSFGYSVEPE